MSEFSIYQADYKRAAVAAEIFKGIRAVTNPPNAISAAVLSKKIAIYLMGGMSTEELQGHSEKSTL